MSRAPRAATLGIVLLVAAVATAAPSLDRIAATGQPAPAGGTFEHFSVESLPVVAPVNTRGQVAFFASVLRGRASEGFFVGAGSRIVKVALEGDHAPGGGTFSGFGKHPIPALNDAGEVAFAAAVAGGKTVEGIFLARRRGVSVVVVAGGPATGIPAGTFAGVDSPALNDRGAVAFFASVRRGRETLEALYVAAGGKLRKIAAQGDAAPAGGAFAGFGPPTINAGGSVAFAAVVEGKAVPGGIFIVEGEHTRMLAGAGDETPAGGIFLKFSERVALNDAGTVAFTALLKNGPVEQAIFAADGGRVRTVVAIGDRAPGGGTFSHFGLWPAVSRSGAIGFTASVDGGPVQVAAFVASGGGVEQLVALGDALPGGGTLSSFGLYPLLAMSPSGTISFATAPTATGQGAEGIYTATPTTAR
jgi:hypothetical protein